MGNFLSQCVTGGGGGAARGGGPVVVLPDGSRFLLEGLTGVAELMIEAPGHVVARARVAAKERRLRALAADVLLRGGEVYLLVPAGRAGVRMGDREVEAIRRLVAGKKAGKGKGSRSGRRIFPEAEAQACVDQEHVADGKGTGCAGKQDQAHWIRSRQWRPALDTIDEASIL